MDKKLIVTIIVECAIGAVFWIWAVGFGGLAEWGNYPFQYQMVPFLATGFVVWLTLAVSSVSALIKSQGNRTVNVLILTLVIVVFIINYFLA
jgi:hypothetical protein